MANIFRGIMKISIYSLVFLLPLFFLPFSFEAYEFNKQYLLFFLVSIAFFSWIAKMVLVDNELRFKRTPLDILVVVFIFLAILSAIFSVDKNSSIFGFYGRFSNGLIGLISLGLLYFLITNNVSLSGKPLINADELPITADKKSAKISQKSALISVSGLIKTFLWAVFFVILFSYFSILKVWGFQFQLPQVMLQSTFNPVSGSMEGLSIFLAVVISLLVGMILLKRAPGKLSSIIYYFLLLTSLGLMIIIDFQASWIVLLVTTALLLGLSIGKRMFRENVNKLLLPIFLLIIALFGLFTNVTRNFLVVLPQEQVLGQSESWGVGFKGAIENVKSGFLGSGIGTFHYDFSKFRSSRFNQTSLLWQIRFDRAGNHLAEILGTMGFLGLISYIALIGFFLMISWFILAVTRKGLPLFPGLPLIMAFLALLISQFFYYQNTTLAFTFWLMLSLSVVSWQKPISEKTISFKDFPELSLIATTLLIILGLSILGCYFFAGKFYLADMKYTDSFGQISEKRIDSLARATKLNPYQTQYKIILARAYLNEVLTEMGRAVPDEAAISFNTQQAIALAKEASDFSPNSVAGWETLGMIYREIRGVAAGATEWGIKSFEKAISLEPTNPVLYTELGKLYLLSNDAQKAKDNFAKAISLKGDYVDALIQEVLISEREGNLEEAISKMENLANSYPFNVEVAFQLGRLYFNGDRLDDAILQLERVVTIFPNHSNAQYALGIAYTKKGQKEKAISAFEKVLELNPGNQDVIQKLEELKK